MRSSLNNLKEAGAVDLREEGFGYDCLMVQRAVGAGSKYFSLVLLVVMIWEAAVDLLWDWTAC